MRLLTTLLVSMLLLTQLANAQAKKSLEDFLKEAEIEYTKLENGELKIPVTLDNETVVVIGKEGAVGDGSVDSLRLFHFYTLVTEVPKGTPLPPEMLKKMAEINDQVLVGRVCLGSENLVFYSSSMWSQNATAELVIQELVLAHIQRASMKKALDPYVQEG